MSKVKQEAEGKLEEKIQINDVVIESWELLQLLIHLQEQKDKEIPEQRFKIQAKQMPIDIQLKIDQVDGTKLMKYEYLLNTQRKNENFQSWTLIEYIEFIYNITIKNQNTNFNTEIASDGVQAYEASPTVSPRAQRKTLSILTSPLTCYPKVPSWQITSVGAEHYLGKSVGGAGENNDKFQDLATVTNGDILAPIPQKISPLLCAGTAPIVITNQEKTGCVSGSVTTSGQKVSLLTQFFTSNGHQPYVPNEAKDNPVSSSSSVVSPLKKSPTRGDLGATFPTTYSKLVVQVEPQMSAVRDDSPCTSGDNSLSEAESPTPSPFPSQSNSQTSNSNNTFISNLPPQTSAFFQAVVPPQKNNGWESATPKAGRSFEI